MNGLIYSLISACAVLMLIGCSGSASNDSGMLIDPDFFVTETNNNNGEDIDSNLFNGLHAVDLGTLELVSVTPLNYDLRSSQVLYQAIDRATGVQCVGSITILLNNAGPNPNYTALIENNLAQDDSIFTISIKDIPGPTHVVGIEYSYGFTINETSFTTLMHAHFFYAEDVIFDNPMLSVIECASQTNSYGLNESQIRSVLDSVVHLRGNEGTSN